MIAGHAEFFWGWLEKSGYLVVVRMAADPVPNKNAVMKPADGPVAYAEADAPLPTADLLKMQRRMKRKLTPNLVVLSSKSAGFGRQAAIEIPEFRCSQAWEV